MISTQAKEDLEAQTAEVEYEPPNDNDVMKLTSMTPEDIKRWEVQCWVCFFQD